MLTPHAVNEPVAAEEFVQQTEALNEVGFVYFVYCYSCSSVRPLFGESMFFIQIYSAGGRVITITHYSMAR